MRRLTTSVVIVIVIVAALATAGAVAAACYDPNRGAVGAYVVTNKGVKGTVDLRPATPVSGAAIAHPGQIASPTSGDFLGWGTAIGRGVAGCPDYFGSRWQIYLDGVRYGVYFCRQGTYGSTPATADNQTFQLVYTSCPSAGSLQWVAYWNGAFKDCVTMNGTAGGAVSAGGESVGTSVKQDITVHYEALRYQLSSSWYPWGTLTRCSDTGYRLRVISNTDFWAEPT